MGLRQAAYGWLVYRVVKQDGRWEVIKGCSSYCSLLYWGIREVTQDRIKLSSFFIYSMNTFTIATRNSTLTMTLTQLDLMSLTD